MRIPEGLDVCHLWVTYKKESTTLFSVFFQIKTFKVLSAVKIIIVYRELENEAVNETLSFLTL